MKWKWLKLLTLLVSVALTDAVKATDTNWPALLPACVCNYKRTLLKLQTLIEPASLPQFQLCSTCKYCVEAAQLLVMLSFTDTVNPGKLLPQLDGEVSTHCWLLGPAGIPCVEHWSDVWPRQVFWGRQGPSCVATTWPRIWFKFFRVLGWEQGGHHQVLMRRAALHLMSPRDSRW